MCYPPNTFRLEAKPHRPPYFAFKEFTEEGRKAIIFYPTKVASLLRQFFLAGLLRGVRILEWRLYRGTLPKNKVFWQNPLIWGTHFPTTINSPRGENSLKGGFSRKGFSPPLRGKSPPPSKKKGRPHGGVPAQNYIPPPGGKPPPKNGPLRKKAFFRGGEGPFFPPHKGRSAYIVEPPPTCGVSPSNCPSGGGEGPPSSALKKKFPPRQRSHLYFHRHRGRSHQPKRKMSFFSVRLVVPPQAALFLRGDFSPRQPFYRENSVF